MPRPRGATQPSAATARRERSIMRLIHCRDCADLAAREGRYRSRPANPEEPAEHVRRYDGRVIGPGLCCDACNKPLEPGEQATAWTAWTDAWPIYAREHGYLERE